MTQFGNSVIRSDKSLLLGVRIYNTYRWQFDRFDKAKATGVLGKIKQKFKTATGKSWENQYHSTGFYAAALVCAGISTKNISLAHNFFRSALEYLAGPTVTLSDYVVAKYSEFAEEQRQGAVPIPELHLHRVRVNGVGGVEDWPLALMFSRPGICYDSGESSVYLSRKGRRDDVRRYGYRHRFPGEPVSAVKALRYHLETNVTEEYQLTQAPIEAPREVGEVLGEVESRMDVLERAVTQLNEELELAVDTLSAQITELSRQLNNNQ